MMQISIDLSEGLQSAIKKVEGQFIAAALTETRGNKTAAAEIAKVSYRTFLEKSARLNIKTRYVLDE